MSIDWDLLRRIKNGYLVWETVSNSSERLEDFFGHKVTYDYKGRVLSVEMWDYVYWDDETLREIDSISVGVGKRGLERIDGLPVRCNRKTGKLSLDQETCLYTLMKKYILKP